MSGNPPENTRSLSPQRAVLAEKVGCFKFRAVGRDSAGVQHKTLSQWPEFYLNASFLGLRA